MCLSCGRCVVVRTACLQAECLDNSGNLLYIGRSDGVLLLYELSSIGQGDY